MSDKCPGPCTKIFLRRCARCHKYFSVKVGEYYVAPEFVYCVDCEVIIQSKKEVYDVWSALTKEEIAAATAYEERPQRVAAVTANERMKTMK